MILLIFLSFVTSWIGVLLMVRFAHRLAARYEDQRPQRFHMGEVPRLGGVGMLVGTLTGWLAGMMGFVLGDPGNHGINLSLGVAACVTLLPGVLAGIAEDLTHAVSIRRRLSLTLLTAALACWQLGLSLNRLNMPYIDVFFQSWPLAGVALAVLAICGLPHAFNIIDGYNGLAGMVALIISLALAHVSLQVGDRTLAAMLLCMSGATAGFLAWNYPRGLVFAGDGGAYLWGIVLAVASIALVQRHQEVSAWFPMLLLMYPVWETVFSIYRKWARGISPTTPDALHFHQLIYRRLIRSVFDEDTARRMLMRNNRTSPWLWGFTIMTVVPAVLFWNRTWVLALFCVLFATSYVTLYLMIVRFKVPHWLRR